MNTRIRNLGKYLEEFPVFSISERHAAEGPAMLWYMEMISCFHIQFLQYAVYYPTHALVFKSLKK
jgi:hypothetical protein